MSDLQTFRQILFDVRKNLFSRRRRRKYAPFQSGLPSGLGLPRLNEACLEITGSAVKSVSYQHLSGWKASGAYRLHFKSERGTDHYLIFKDAIYDFAEIPALDGLPVCPGPPEYAVFSQPVGDLTLFLPRIYQAEEIVPGKHYRYLVEDMAIDFQNAAASQAALQISKRLPEIHQALSDWVEEADTSGFIHYGPAFTRSLQEYAQKKLSAYQQVNNEPLLDQALNLWGEITALHQHPVFSNLAPTSPIHGDMNFTNIYIHKRDSNRIKVVDWEWAGFGSPHADLVSLLKGTGQMMERKAFKAYVDTASKGRASMLPDLPDNQLYQYYLWNQLERGMLDSAFLAAQRLYTQHNSHINLTSAITGSLQRMLTAYQRLTS